MELRDERLVARHRDAPSFEDADDGERIGEGGLWFDELARAVFGDAYRERVEEEERQ